ncbi:DUF1801 domain-containing protein [Vibrio mediterranei]|uniref:DUF1801 domain-containing protein n=1 Tax=Vibrio mediterranei TaxID=689 RepID=UPI00148B6B7B|nr:DUF1801 domain-containing protein [Vibrio mediterranei]NOI26721.1 DUF1801 domain-containing protein [Vibrio mediterranei]
MDKSVEEKFNQYPNEVRSRMLELRTLIYQVAKEFELGEVKESLKWGEPSYSVEGGSPIRIDWKLNTPTQYYLYFNCQSKLVDTFKELYGESLQFQGNRAIILSISKPLPSMINQCVTLAFTYHNVKHLPLLGQ